MKGVAIGHRDCVQLTICQKDPHKVQKPYCKTLEFGKSHRTWRVALQLRLMQLQLQLSWASVQGRIRRMCHGGNCLVTNVENYVIALICSSHFLDAE